MNNIRNLFVRHKTTGHLVAKGKSIRDLMVKLPVQLDGLSDKQSAAVRKKLESATVPPEGQPLDLGGGYELCHISLNVS